MSTHAAWPPIARTGYRYRHGKAPRQADIGELLSKLGTRHSMRDESLAAMELLRRLASRSTSAPPQSHADVCLISRVTALEEVVKSLAVASKDASGLISDHEIAILQLEMDIESIVRQPEAEVKVEPTDDVNLRFRENQPAGENPELKTWERSQPQAGRSPTRWGGASGGIRQERYLQRHLGYI